MVDWTHVPDEFGLHDIGVVLALDYVPVPFPSTTTSMYFSLCRRLLLPTAVRLTAGASGIAESPRYWRLEKRWSVERRLG